MLALELNGNPAGKVQLDCSGQIACNLLTIPNYPSYTATDHTGTVAVPPSFSASFLAQLAGAGSNV